MHEIQTRCGRAAASRLTAGPLVLVSVCDSVSLDICLPLHTSHDIIENFQWSRRKPDLLSHHNDSAVPGCPLQNPTQGHRIILDLFTKGKRAGLIAFTPDGPTVTEV